jgi:hypothetical protein
MTADVATKVVSSARDAEVMDGRRIANRDASPQARLPALYLHAQRLGAFWHPHANPIVQR